MAQAQLIPPATLPPPRPTSAPAVLRPFRFTGLVVTLPRSVAKRRSATVALSIVIHVVLVLAVIVVPLFFADILPAPSEAVRAFFVTPAQVALPPPPPPPPAAGVRAAPKAPAAPRLSEARFTAPVEVPQEIPREETLDLGVEGGVPGGVEGGVPGGVVGGIVGGLPTTERPAPVTKVIRVGGHIHPPKLVHRVDPEYPPLAQAARVQGVVILEAMVDTAGRVRSVTVLRGIPLLDDAARGAVKQWRYMPLLLNGEPTEFVLTVTVAFNLNTPGQER